MRTVETILNMFLQQAKFVISLRERKLLAAASKLVEAASNGGNIVYKDKEQFTNGCLEQAIMNRLRSSGYNATVCKSKWDHANGYPS